jgi:hypothetical protein
MADTPRWLPVWHLGTQWVDEGIVGIDVEAVGPLLVEAGDDWREDGGPATWLDLGPVDADGYQTRILVALSVADTCRMLNGEIPPPAGPPEPHGHED